MDKINHTERKHALLSASGAVRWLACPPSARLEEKFEESNPTPSSIFAEEGTLAHEFGDLILKKYNGEISEKVFNTEIKTLQGHELYSNEMEEQVDKYTSYVIEEYLKAKKVTPDAILMIEEQLDFSHIVEQGFGTGDTTIISDGTMEIVDLKYGKGIQVYAEDNPQLKLYAAGALRKFELMYDINTIKMTIVQPRLDHISSAEISVEELESWGSDYVKPIASMAYLGDGEQKAGDHCKWCKVKATCVAMSEANMNLARYEFRDPHLISDDDLLAIYNQIPMLTDWAKSVDEYILEQALKGKKWSGYKLVAGRSQRKWIDPDEVEKILKSKRFRKKDYTQTKLLGIPAIEKLVGKSAFPEVLGEQVLIPPGKPTVVPESDKRPAFGIDQAKIDFDTEI